MFLIDFVFDRDDDEFPPIEWLRINEIIFLCEHPKINLLELLIKFEQPYIENYSDWISKFFGKLIKKKPRFLKNKIEILREKGVLPIPVERECLGNNKTTLDYSGMNDISIMLYNMYKSLVDY